MSAATVSRPAIRVNQVGYLPGGPKLATWIDETTEPVAFSVSDRQGRVAFRGESQPWPIRPEPTSGQAVHVLDFSALSTGAGYRVEIGAQHCHPFAVGDGCYDDLARDALGMFYLLRSGCPIDDDRAPGYGRPAGHLGDRAVPAWTGAEAERLYPGWSAPGTFDVSGGWYDAGDYGKYATSGSIAVWQLLNLLPLLNRGSRLSAALLAECRWQLDWLLRMQVPAGRPLAGMVFHRVHGTVWSPMPGWAHEDPTRRVLHRPSTAATLQMAAVAAQGARLLRGSDPAYADRLLRAAVTAYRAAWAYPVLIPPDDEGRFGGGPYGDPDPSDDFYWAATELWLTTGEEPYATDLRASPWHRADAAEVFDDGGFDFDRIAGPAQLDLAGPGPEPADGDRVAASVVDAGRRLQNLATAQPWGQPYAPRGGWAWGSNGRILNNLVVIATAARLAGGDGLRRSVAGGMDYLLGRNALGQSYVVGCGTDASAHPRARQFGHDLDPRFPPAPRGALTGGANSVETPGFPSDPRLVGLPPQRCYLDEPTSETTNDICIRWNAPLVYVAGILSSWCSSTSTSHPTWSRT